MTYKIKILSHGKGIRAKNKEILADRIQQAGIDLNLSCNKRGLCGKCFVEIVKGHIPRPKEKELAFIQQKKLPDNFRLSCQYQVKNDLVLRIPEDSLLQKVAVLETGFRRSVAVNPAVKKYLLQMKRPTIESTLSLLDLVQLQFEKHYFPVSLDIFEDLAYIIEENDFKTTAIVYDESEFLGFEKPETIDKNFGLAIDLGTTTLVVELVDLTTGKTVDVLTGLNSQVKYGSDIISRITATFMEPKRIWEFKKSIFDSLNRMIEQILRKNRVHSNFVYEIVIGGNTAMNHFLLGLPLRTLAVSPYHSIFSDLPALPSSELGFPINKYGKVYIVPNIKSFVGGDITAGLVASDMENKKGNYLFIDLGTNGEIVLKKGNRFIATSTAAGPAFEGMNISHGMLAFPGAIYKADDNKRLKVFTIAGKPVRGICGTGLIDLVALFLKRKAISAEGKIQLKSKIIPITKNIYLNQKDIREMQLAVAAIKTGIKMLFKRYSLSSTRLDGIFIAGAFGNYLNVGNSMKIGLLPEIEKKKIHFIGNSSLSGAKAMLVSREEREKGRHLVRRIQHFSLAADPSFQKTFINSLVFEPWS